MTKRMKDREDRHGRLFDCSRRYIKHVDPEMRNSES